MEGQAINPRPRQNATGFQVAEQDFNQPPAHLAEVNMLGAMSSPLLSFCIAGAAQQFWRMYVPSMLAVLPLVPELSVLLMVWATVKESN